MCEYVKDYKKNRLYKLDVDLPVTGDEKPAITTTTTTIAHSTALTKPVQTRKGVQKNIIIQCMDGSQRRDASGQISSSSKRIFSRNSYKFV
jgi:hypothetical protein